MHKQLDDAKKEQYENLSQGDKIRFKWWGNSTAVYIGRIEVSKWGSKYFVLEDYYEEDKLTNIGESMRFYNELQDFWEFTEFNLLEKHQGENDERSVATGAK